MSKSQPPASKPSNNNLVRQYLFPLIEAYGAGTALHLCLRAVIGEKSVFIAFLNTFAHLLWLPALVLFPFALLFRRKRAMLLLLPSLVAFIASYGRQFMPRNASAPASATTFTLLTYNVLSWNSDVNGRIKVIREVNADVVGFQELTPYFAARIEAELADVYPYRALHPGKDASEGQGVISRFPIIADEYWRSTYVPISLGHQRVQLDIQGTHLTYYNVHPVHPGMAGRFFDPSYRQMEITEILRRLGNESDALILAGDFNMPDQTEDYQRITATYRDAFREAGFGMGWTFPHSPILRLDYVFHNDQIMTVDAQVWSDTGDSDHHPLKVTLAVLPAVKQQ
jgi:vancomycin resistance protein VanJ